MANFLVALPAELIDVIVSDQWDGFVLQINLEVIISIFMQTRL